MARNLVKRRSGESFTIGADDSSLIDADDARAIEAPVRGAGAFTFHYSYTEISSAGGKSRVKSRSARYENGKLSRESFDGEFDGRLYDGAVHDMQRAFADQASLMLRAFASLFTLPGMKHRSDD
jgi:hypothetical protein